MPVIIEAAKADVTMGEMCDAFRETWGIWRRARSSDRPAQRRRAVPSDPLNGTAQSIDSPLARPLLRGVLHEVGLGVALVAGTFLIVGADGGRASVALMLAASTLYHRVTWRPRARLWMRRVDHAGIYVLIAGTYTAVGLISLHGVLQWTVLSIVWAGALAATLTKFCWVRSPKWVSVAFAVTLGWVGLAALPQLESSAGPAAVILLLTGGLAYTAGAIVYARGRPDPAPAVFGYHEVFHALTLVAIACQYVAIAFFVVRSG
jgi:hemolysin III